MKNIKKTISTLVLGLIVFAFPVLGCGDMTSGSKCLVQTTPTTIETKIDKTPFYGVEKQIEDFFRGFFGKIFG